MLSSNKGIAIILLIATITMTAVIGAGFVSLMTAKQKGYATEIQSYQALNRAHAGVEFAIRYAYDNKDGFFGNEGLYASTYIPNIPAASCTTANGKAVRNASNVVLFYLCYNNDQLTSIGVYGPSTRKIVLRNFSRYVLTN